jgi:geranylgeranyl diphosphate synthase type II
MMNNDLILALKQNSELIESAIKEHYSNYDDSDTDEVRIAEQYSLNAGGKRIRAFLVNEFCRACGGNVSDSIQYALAVEMIHTFSLIHDDLPCMDDDDLRRGKPTSHKVFGEATALLAGDALSVRAFSVISNNSSLDAKLNLEAVKILSDAVSSEGMIGGQIIDMRGEKEKLEFETLLKLHAKKTGALISASAMLGCLAAGVDKSDKRFNAARNYAVKIGLAFQIIDDILDATADVSVLGKNTGADADRNKTTFLSFMSIDDAYLYAKRLTEEAKNEIDILEDQKLLQNLADYLLNRDK